VGHRGAAGLKPENTLSGFMRALDLGVDAIEIDVLMTADKKLVVHHDYGLKPEIARSPDGSWLSSQAIMPIMNMSVEQLQKFDVGRLKPGTRYASKYPQQVPSDGERIPLLLEVIQLLKNSDNSSIELWIEIKTTPESPSKTPPPETVAQHVVALLQDHQFTQRVKILSFDWRSLVHIQKIAPIIPTVYLTSDTKQFKAASFLNPWESDWTAGFDIGKHGGSIPKTIQTAGGSWWAPKYKQVKAKQVKEAHQLGLCVAVWTPDSNKAFKQMIQMGVDAIITNRPDRLLSRLKSTE
jgi:glycerophosphoryl diester phosphodiesterase